MRLLELTIALCTVAATALVPTSAPTDNPISVRHGYGIRLSTDRPFYSSGSTVRARYEISNFSPQDAFGVSPGGGLGCKFNIFIRDGLGQTVWEPMGVYCQAVDLIVDLSVGKVSANVASIPLVFQNKTGIGPFGSPLPPGSYEVCVVVRFGGPGPSASGGKDFTATVPIRINA